VALLLVLRCIFPEIETNARCFLWKRNKILLHSDLREEVFPVEIPSRTNYTNDRLTEIGRCCGVEVNVEKKISGNENLMGTISITDCDRSETTGECGIF
jgi:hypothetical protein